MGGIAHPAALRAADSRNLSLNLTHPLIPRPSRVCAERSDLLERTLILLPFPNTPDPPTTPSDLVLKRRLRNSRVLAALLLIPGIPIIAACALLVRLTSRGNPFYAQERVGLNGRVFTMFKIRSMRIDAESATGPLWAKDDDARVTTIGRFIRFTHLDELPQLFNILRGDMCINGPRPERPVFVEDLAEKIPRYTERLSVHPGVTGLAQVRAPADSDLQSVRNKLSLDLAYIRDLAQERTLDLRILCATVLKMIGVPQLSAARLFRLHSVETVSIPRTAETEVGTPARRAA